MKIIAQQTIVQTTFPGAIGTVNAPGIIFFAT